MEGADKLAIDEKYTDDVQKLLDLGKEKAFLTYDDINNELPESVISPDDIEDIFATLGAEGIAISDSEEKFLESAAVSSGSDKKLEDMPEEELELDLTPGMLDKTNDPVRLYLREMGIVPLLTREGEVAIAKRIERGKKRKQKATSRSPVAIAELIRIGEELSRAELPIREIVTFNEQEGITEEKIEEYHQYTLETILEISRHFKKTQTLYEKYLLEPKRSPKLHKIRRKLARQRIELSHLVRLLEFTPSIEERLVKAITLASTDVIKAEREIDGLQHALERKRSVEVQKDYEKRLRAARRHLVQIEEKHHVGALELRRARQAVVTSQTEVDKAQIEVNAATRELKRNEELLESGVISRLDYDSAKDRVENAKVSLNTARARLESSRISVKDATGRLAQQNISVRDARRGVETASINVSSSQSRANQQSAVLRGQKNQ
ncbi:MAG: RNA polymerase sigma factor region1.1 domain-containing protein, partial [Acidobacteriota bacterium]